MKTRYTNAINQRGMATSTVSQIEAAKLVPVSMVPFRENEGGSVNVEMEIQLERIAGRVLSEIHAEVVSVFVPVPAMDVVNDPENPLAGNEELLNNKLTSGVPLFDLEDENEISKRCHINPISIAGEKKVSAAVRLSHVAGVNYLRRKKYLRAAQLPATETAITPALLSRTVLDRLNAVLDPEDRVNGAVDLGAEIPVEGIYRIPDQNATRAAADELSGFETGDDAEQTFQGWRGLSYSSDGTPPNGFAEIGIEQDPDNPSAPKIIARMTGDGKVTLSDFYKAERQDELVRQISALLEKHPELGSDVVMNFAAGLEIPTNRQPFIVFETDRVFGMVEDEASDTYGVNNDIRYSQGFMKVRFTRVIPKTKFGGILVTFVSIKPNESLAAQPHPFLAEAWTDRKHMQDELAIDPDPVTVRELHSDCDPADEGTIALYTARNELYRNYVTYGFDRYMDPTTVENEVAIWQLDVPMSVTPESVLYPAEFTATPFAVTDGYPVARARTTMVAAISTPMMFGKRPVEEVPEIEDADVFGDAQLEA